MDKILITGGEGQLGSVLSEALSQKYGYENVIVSDIVERDDLKNPFEILNVVHYAQIVELIKKHKITKVFHLAAILSANGEKDIIKTRKVNAKGFFNVLNAAGECSVEQVFYPSSIAVFGPDAPKDTPQNVALNPTTAYGITKVVGEDWAHYFYNRYGLDVRSLRFPGVIGHQSMPGGGTTDYAVTIFHSAIQGERFECFLKKDEYLPMIYMDDAIRAIMELMDADSDTCKIRTSYNLSGLSFSPEEIAAEIKKHIPSFRIEYKPDYRQEIAASWPDAIIDTEARKEWNWLPRYDLENLVKDMIRHLKLKKAENYV